MSKLLGSLPSGLLFVVSAPAGTGKTTLVRMLMDEFSCVKESVSYTTRPPRLGEVEGKDYHFISREEFLARKEAGDFLEWAEVFGKFYGTSKTQVEAEQKRGNHVVLVIDTQGALVVREKVEAVLVFLAPPSLGALRERLAKRGTEKPDALEERLSWAEREISLAPRYDYKIVNDDLKTAYQALRSILIAEEHKTSN